MAQEAGGSLDGLQPARPAVKRYNQFDDSRHVMPPVRLNLYPILHAKEKRVGSRTAAEMSKNPKLTADPSCQKQRNERWAEPQCVLKYLVCPVLVLLLRLLSRTTRHCGVRGGLLGCIQSAARIYILRAERPSPMSTRCPSSVSFQCCHLKQGMKFRSANGGGEDSRNVP